MYQIVTLKDDSHFRYHERDGAGLRVSFDQTDREQVWAVLPRPPAGDSRSVAQWIADYSATLGACVEIASTRAAS